MDIDKDISPLLPPQVLRWLLPALGEVHLTTFARQAANHLWKAKERLCHLAGRLLDKILSHTVAFLLNYWAATNLCNWRSSSAKTCT
jgi:hypothetical protein